MSSVLYDNSDTVYITVQALNPSQTNSNTIICNINQQSNPIVQDLSNYDIFLQSLTCNTSEVPFFNIYRQIAWDPTNFTDNITNMTISFLATAGTPFDLTGNANRALVGCGASDGAEKWQGVSCYLKYVSENSTLPNTNTSTYPRTYFNIHSIQEFLDMVNTAINSICAVPNALIAPNTMYFYYDPLSQLYQFYAPSTFPNAGVNMYANTFLEYRLDSFRWSFLQNSIVVAPPMIINNLASPYQGLDYQFNKKNFPNNLFNNVYTYYSEYSSLANLIDIHSLLIVADSGQLQAMRQQIIPLSTNSQSQNALNLPTIACLKSLDIELNSLNVASINNTYIQYEAQGLFFPVNSLIQQSFTNIGLTLYIQNVENDIYPLLIPAGNGYCNIKFALKRKNKK